MTWTEDAENEAGERGDRGDRSSPRHPPRSPPPRSPLKSPPPRNPPPRSPQLRSPQPRSPLPRRPAAEPAEEPAAEPAAEESAAEPAARSPPPTDPKKDVVPGADLEPIAIGEERELTAEERAAREAEEEERAAREAAAAADDDDEEIAPRTVTVPADTKIQATGKRKSAVARIIVRSGNGDFQINDRGIEEYFKSSQHQALARQPLVTAGYEGSVDVKVRVHGGGISGQAGAVRHGVARALTTLEPELRGDLKKRGMLTRDDRRKERKKAGLKKARKRPQFSKRCSTAREAQRLPEQAPLG